MTLSTKVFRYDTMNYSRSELIDALIGQYESLISDSMLDDTDLTLEQYIESLQTKSIDELVYEATSDEYDFSLDDFMFAYG